MNMYRFQAKRPTYDHFHSIVCDKVPIFGIYVCFGMGNNVAELSFFKFSRFLPNFTAVCPSKGRVAWQSRETRLSSHCQDWPASPHAIWQNLIY